MHAHPIPPNIHTQTYPHLPPKVMHALSVMGLVEKRRKMTYQYSKENRWVLSFDLQEESECACLIERGFRFMATHKLIGALLALTLTNNPHNPHTNCFVVHREMPTRQAFCSVPREDA